MPRRYPKLHPCHCQLPVCREKPGPGFRTVRIHSAEGHLPPNCGSLHSRSSSLASSFSGIQKEGKRECIRVRQQHRHWLRQYPTRVGAGSPYAGAITVSGLGCIQDKPALRRLGPPAAALQHALEVEAARATPPSDVDTPKPTSSHPPTRPAIGCQTTPTPESSAWLENDADWSLSPAFALL